MSVSYRLRRQNVLSESTNVNIFGKLKLCFCFLVISAREENVATFRGSEYFCYDLSQNPIQSSSDEITLSFKTWQRNGLLLHTGKSADYVNLALKDGAVSLVINLGSGAFEAIVEPVNGKFNDNAWHDIKVTRNLRQVIGGCGESFWEQVEILICFCFRSDAFKSIVRKSCIKNITLFWLVPIPPPQFIAVFWDGYHCNFWLSFTNTCYFFDHLISLFGLFSTEKALKQTKAVLLQPCRW